MSEREKARRERQAQLTKIRANWERGLTQPISASYKQAEQDREAKGPIWVSRTVLPAPAEDDLRQALFRAIVEMGDAELRDEDRCESSSVAAEWVAHRPGVDAKAPEPAMSEAAKYDAITKQISRDAPTILYVHGGGAMSGSPASSRNTTARLAAATKGRVLAIKYRFAPRHPFPAQLLDLATAYFSLLSPGAGCTHAAVPPEHLILTGESSGAALATSLLALLLHLRRAASPASLLVNGRATPIALPRGMALVSPFLLGAQSHPLYHTTRAAASDVFLTVPLLLRAERAPEPGLWPSAPPRAHWLARTPLLAHPLMDAQFVRAADWAGAPPVWIARGDERVAHGVELLAGALRRGGARVQVVRFDGMPHLWWVLLPRAPSAGELLRRWGAAVVRLARGRGVDAADVLVEEGSLREVPAPAPAPGGCGSAEFWEAATREMRRAHEARPVWTGGGAGVKAKV